MIVRLLIPTLICLLSINLAKGQDTEPNPLERGGGNDSPPTPAQVPQLNQPGNIGELKKRLEDPDLDSEKRHLIEKEIARAYISISDFPNAIKHMQSSMDLQEKPAVQEYQALTRLYFQSEQIEEGHAVLKEGIKHYPDSIDLSQLLTMVYRHNEQWKKAIAEYEKMEKLNKEGPNRPFSESFYFYYGVSVERGLGDVDRAAQLFQTCLERIPDPNPRDMRGIQNTRLFKAQVLNYLGYMQIEKGVNVDVAGELIKKAAALDPESGAIADSLGWYYFKKEQYMEAMVELLRAESMMEEGKEDGVIFDHIAQTYFKLNNKKSAIDYIKRAIEKEPKNKEYKNRLKEYSVE